MSCLSNHFNITKSPYTAASSAPRVVHHMSCLCNHFNVTKCPFPAALCAPLWSLLIPFSHSHFTRCKCPEHAASLPSSHSFPFFPGINVSMCLPTSPPLNISPNKKRLPINSAEIGKDVSNSGGASIGSDSDVVTI